MMPPTSTDGDDLGRFGEVMQSYASIGLPELFMLDQAILLDRIDVKYLLRPQQVLAALVAIQPYYRVLEVGGLRLQQYRTLYFDTDDFVLYLQHQSEARSRYKVRFRTYVNSDLTFLEVKLKNNKDRTIKNRIEVAAATPIFDAPMQTFLRSMQPFDPQALAPRIQNSFIRITLVSNDAKERLTIDLNIQFDDDDATTFVPALAIVEVKQNHYSRVSPFVQQARTVGGHEIGITKYCVGAAIRYPHLKANNFKPAFLRIQKLAGYRH